ncbi:MAG: HAMP domain-containing protein [Chromatiales bacterium]|nr:HAMP domain-containing protein [Chromatiales bacterium]
MVVSTVLGRRLTASILSIRHAAERYGDGVLGAWVETTGPAEIGDLGRTFNAMADVLTKREESLKSSALELQAEVDRRKVAETRAIDSLEALRTAQDKDGAGGKTVRRWHLRRRGRP